MKIKAKYKRYEDSTFKEDVLIVDFDYTRAVCLDKYGKIFTTNYDRLFVVDELYMNYLNENRNAN